MKKQFDPQPLIADTELVEDAESLKKFFAKIHKAKIVAVDIESAAFYKYYSRVNLIQIATRQYRCIIDPQKIENFSVFREFCQNSDCCWIFHGGDYDVSMLARDLKIFIPRMFDTRKAAEFIGMKELGLKALTNKYLGFSLDKKLQRCDWSRRPLTKAMRDYAILDAICLIPIYDSITKELEAMGRIDWVLEECEFILAEACKAKEIKLDPYAFRIKGSSKLSARSLAVLKEVWRLREKIAKKIDRAPFMVLSNQALLDIAQTMPRTVVGLSAIKTIGREFLNRHVKDLQFAVKSGLEAPLDGLDRPIESRHQQMLLTAWEGELAKSLRILRDTIANRLGIAPSLLVPSQALYELAKLRPANLCELRNSGILHNWQVEVLAKDFLPLLQQKPPLKLRKRKRHRQKNRLSNC